MRRRLQVDLGANDVQMAEVGGQQRQLGVNINALVGPGCETMNGKGVAKLVRTRTGTACGRLEAQLTQQSADRLGGRSDREPRGIPTEKECLWIRPAKIAHQPLSLGNVATEFGDEVGANDDEPRTALAAPDHQGSAVEIDISGVKAGPPLPILSRYSRALKSRGAASRPR